MVWCAVQCSALQSSVVWCRVSVSLCLCLCMQVVIPEQCLLNPSSEAAVVGGNVLTSQRVTDVVLKAFGAAAASQVRKCLV